MFCAAAADVSKCIKDCHIQRYLLARTPVSIVRATAKHQHQVGQAEGEAYQFEKVSTISKANNLQARVLPSWDVVDKCVLFAQVQISKEAFTSSLDEKNLRIFSRNILQASITQTIFLRLEGKAS